MNPVTIINKYHRPGSQNYFILIAHSLLVTNLALEIAQEKKLKIDQKFIYEAGMLHDVGWQFPQYDQLDKKEAKEIRDSHCYLAHGYWGAQIMRREGLERHARVCENHLGVGIKKEEIILKKWPIPCKDYFPQNLEEELLSYADLFYSKNLESIFEKESRANIIEEIKKFDFSSEKIATFLKWDRKFIF